MEIATIESRFSKAVVCSIIICRAITNMRTSSIVSFRGLHKSLKNSIPITISNTLAIYLRNAPDSERVCRNSLNGAHKEQMAITMAMRTMAAIICSNSSLKFAYPCFIFSSFSVIMFLQYTLLKKIPSINNDKIIKSNNPKNYHNISLTMGHLKMKKKIKINSFFTCILEKKGIK